jgi:fatty acid desaturase
MLWIFVLVLFTLYNILMLLLLCFCGFYQFFVIGHDCAHKSFANNKLLEDIVGTLAFLPLIYPYEPWRFKHDRHHAKTNMLEEDTAWHPVVREEWNNSPKSMQVLLEYSMGPLRPWASIGHWLVWHFDLKKYRPSEIPRVKVSLAAVFAFMAVGWPLIIYYTGIAGWFKFWLMPWLGYHFWVCCFTARTMCLQCIQYVGLQRQYNASPRSLMCAFGEACKAARCTKASAYLSCYFVTSV